MTVTNEQKREVLKYYGIKSDYQNVTLLRNDPI